jgi:queuine tRNA-ribosyltransferase
MKPINWKVIAQEGEARAGILQTRRSIIETPVFMPVGTQGTVKGVRFEWLEDEMDARVILGNTYHLFLRPGAETIRQLGGLHKFTTWNRSFLTDSGGFQVFSLTDLRKLTEEGVEFRSHLDGDKKFLSPEVSMEIQAALGSEIVMVFDECPPGDAGIDVTRKSLEMTARWALRSKNRFDELQENGQDTGFLKDEGGRMKDESDKQFSDLLIPHPSSLIPLSGQQALFGIVQGAGHLDLRKESLDKTVEIGFDGYAIGGLSVGEEKSVMYEVIDFLAPQMPSDAPRYLMGVGTPEDLVEAVYRGIDMFDCVMPTRNGRTGSAFTSGGKINIRNAKYIKDEAPMDGNCPCSVCRRYSKAYLRHLYQAKEMLAATLISHHNLAFFLDLMRQIREAIKSGNFGEFRREFLSRMSDN